MTLESMEAPVFRPTLLLSYWPLLCLTTPLLFFWFKRNKQAGKESMESFFRGFRVGGHRGSPIKQPENTMESMRQAKLDGVDLVEFDVSLTKDGIAILLHDDTLDRTTNFTGSVRAYSHADLRLCNPGAKFCRSIESVDEAPTMHTIPTLDAVVEWAKESQTKLLFDVKNSDAELMLKLLSLFAEHPHLYESSIICSFFPSVVYKIKRRNPRILTGITWRRWFFSHHDTRAENPRFYSPLLHGAALLVDMVFVWSVKTWLPAFLGVELILTEHTEISESFVHMQHKRGRKVCAWTVNDVSEMAWMRNSLKIPFLTDIPHMATSIQS